MKKIKLTADKYCDLSAEITTKFSEKKVSFKNTISFSFFAALADKLFGGYDETKEIVSKRKKDYHKIAIDTATDLAMGNPEMGLVITLAFVALAKKLFQADGIEEEEPEKKITLTEFFKSEEKLAIHCKSPDEAEVLLAAFAKVGKRWDKDDCCLNTDYSKYLEETCYSNKGTFASLSFYKEFEEVKVFEFDEVDLDA
ncbi:MAG: hypothetical protein L6U99_03070 [Clostridium sp.]|nr:MAG: hypothetical protein L6U99_03070 [Clostridium sp.]